MELVQDRALPQPEAPDQDQGVSVGRANQVLPEKREDIGPAKETIRIGHRLEWVVRVGIHRAALGGVVSDAASVRWGSVRGK